MRIVVSLLGFRPSKIGGTETYLRRLMGQLPAAAAPDEVLFVADRDLARSGIVPTEHRATLAYSGRRVFAQRALEAVSPYRARGVERFIASLRPDVVFFPQQSIFPKFVDAPCAVVVHDLYHHLYPQHLSVIQRVFRNTSYEHSLARADQVIAISDITRRSVIDRCGVPPEKIVTVPHGYDSPRSVESTVACPIAGPFLYYPASSYPHKNHAALFSTVARLRDAGKFPYQLVLTGMQTRHWKALRRQISELSLDDVVTHLGFVGYETVASLYRQAACVVFPSLYEGFGIPVLEALSYRKKFICSRLPIFDELGVPRQSQIDFENPSELLQAIMVPEAANLERCPISWRQSIQMTTQVLRSVGRPALRLFDPKAMSQPNRTTVSPLVACVLTIEDRQAA